MMYRLLAVKMCHRTMVNGDDATRTATLKNNSPTIDTTQTVNKTIALSPLPRSLIPCTNPSILAVNQR